MLTTQTHKTDAGVVLAVTGHIQAGGSADQLLREAAALTSAGTRLLVADLSGVESVDAGGVGALVGVRNLCVRQGTNLVLVGANRRIRQLLTLCGLDGKFQIGDPASFVQDVVERPIGSATNRFLMLSMAG